MSPPLTKARRAARKGSPSRKERSFKIGDWVRIVDVSQALKNPSYDLRDAVSQEMRTAELCRFCVGHEFQVKGFQHELIELEVSDDPAVRRKFGKWHTIWIEPEFLKRVGTQRLKARPTRVRNGTPEGVPRY